MLRAPIPPRSPCSPPCRGRQFTPGLSASTPPQSATHRSASPGYDSPHLPRPAPAAAHASAILARIAPAPRGTTGVPTAPSDVGTPAVAARSPEVVSRARSSSDLSHALPPTLPAVRMVIHLRPACYRIIVQNICEIRANLYLSFGTSSDLTGDSTGPKRSGPAPGQQAGITKDEVGCQKRSHDSAYLSLG